MRLPPHIVADQTKARQDEDVNLGVAKKPEQVHIEHRVATTPWVESGGVSVAIGEEHRESTRKHGQGEQEQKVGDEHAPHKQGNSLHRQCRPTSGTPKKPVQHRGWKCPRN